MHDLKRYVLKPLVLIGALNWGLIGIFNFDLVAAIFGYGTAATRMVYALVGIAAVLFIIIMFMPRDQKMMRK